MVVFFLCSVSVWKYMRNHAVMFFPFLYLVENKQQMNNNIQGSYKIFKNAGCVLVGLTCILWATDLHFVVQTLLSLICNSTNMTYTTSQFHVMIYPIDAFKILGDQMSSISRNDWITGPAFCGPPLLIDPKFEPQLHKMNKSLDQDSLQANFLL